MRFKVCTHSRSWSDLSWVLRFEHIRTLTCLRLDLGTGTGRIKANYLWFCEVLYGLLGWFVDRWNLESNCECLYLIIIAGMEFCARYSSKYYSNFSRIYYSYFLIMWNFSSIHLRKHLTYIQNKGNIQQYINLFM